MLELARVQDFPFAKGAHVVPGQGQHRDRMGAGRNKLHFKGRAVRIAVDDPANVAGGQAVFRQITGQDHRVQFLNHRLTPLH
jgi:hypothetical protein